MLLVMGKEVIAVWNDAAWLELYKTEDQQTFEVLIEHYKAYVFAIILRFVDNTDDAQDIAQEVFLQIYRSLPSFQPDHLKAWVGRITTNKAIDWKRKKQRSVQGYELSDTDIGKPLADSLPNPEEAFISKEREVYIRELCSSLPDRYRTVLIKYHFQDKSYQQIAREEGISVKTVETRLYRARKLLRQLWKEGKA